VRTLFCPACLNVFEADRASCPSLACAASRPAGGWEALYEPGDLLDRHYRVQAVLALAGSGVTYRARAVDDAREPNGPEVAVKVLYAHRGTPEHIRRLADEAQILRELAHPGIVECRAFVHRIGAPPYLVTTFEQGGTLAEHVARVGPLAPPVAGRVLAQILMALDQAHRRGVVHGDLKPQNILLKDACAADEIPRVRVADFGIARITTRTHGPTRVRMFVGTPAFAAPEQFLGHPATAATDVFAAGAVMWWLCSGRTLAPITDPSDVEAAYDALLSALPPRLSGHAAGIDALRAFLDGCLAIDPARRARIGTLLAALDDLTGVPTRLAQHAVIDPGGVTLAPSATGITFVVPVVGSALAEPGRSERRVTPDRDVAATPAAPLRAPPAALSLDDLVSIVRPTRSSPLVRDEASPAPVGVGAFAEPTAPPSPFSAPPSSLSAPPSSLSAPEAPPAQRLADGRGRVGLKRVWSDGTTAIELSPLELVEKLAAIVPPPRVNQVRYHGVLAGNAAWRAEVVPKVPTSSAAEEEARRARRLSTHRGPRFGREAPGGADLLWRVFQVDGWACPACGGRMRLRMVVDLAPAAKRIATGLLRSRAPPGAVPPGEDQGAGAHA
jgi:serine/threonine protein kinase